MKFKLYFSIILMSFIPVTEACTSFILKTTQSAPIYGRTLEWGAFDLKSNLLIVPRRQETTSDLGNKVSGMTWKNKYGYVALNALNQPFVLDGMNEKGLTIGTLYFPGFAQFQTYNAKYREVTMNNVDLSSYILGNFDNVKDLQKALHEIRVVANPELEKLYGAPTDLHHIITDQYGKTIIVEYTKGELHIYDDNVGVMTNSPSYDWHMLNIRNFLELSPYGIKSLKVGNTELKPFGQGSGMLGLPGDSTPPSRFIRALAFKTSTMPLKSNEVAINEASRILNNFDIPKGWSREGAKKESLVDYTQWSVIGDISQRKYYWWTESNRRMRMIDLNKLNFNKKSVVTLPLEKNASEDILEIKL